MREPGVLFLVVGPSGVGKDSVLDGARVHFENNEHVIFPSRFITRPEDAGGEAHTELTETDFIQMEAAGDFALTWNAHGFNYAIPAKISSYLAEGCNVVINVSRTVIDDARHKYSRVQVIYITAHPDIIAERLVSRGRESNKDILARIERAKIPVPKDKDLCIIDNSGSLEASIRKFCGLVETKAYRDYFPFPRK